MFAWPDRSAHLRNRRDFSVLKHLSSLGSFFNATIYIARGFAMGRPRLDRYQRLIHRFYESLILAKILVPAEGSHISILEDTFGQQFTRRRLLRNLAFICDFEKGGDTTTAIAIEERHDTFNFWVGCNTDPTKRIIPFLISVLCTLKELSHGQGEPSLETQFTRECVMFAQNRIKKEGKLLKNAILKSRSCLENDLQRHGTSPSVMVHCTRQARVPTMKL